VSPPRDRLQEGYELGLNAAVRIAVAFTGSGNEEREDCAQAIAEALRHALRASSPGQPGQETP
jgi:hypothetical protein